MDRLDNLRLGVSVVQSVLATGYKPRGLIGTQVLPWFRVVAQSVRAPTFGREAFRLVEDRRALHREPAEVSWDVTYQDMSLVEHTIQVPMDRTEREAASEVGIDMVSRSRQTAQRIVAVNREKEIADLVTATGSYDSTNRVALSTTWDTFTSGVSDADPLLTFDAARDEIRGDIGMLPNMAWMGYTTWAALMRNTYILDRLPGGTGADATQKRLTEEALRAMLGVEYLFIGMAHYADADNAFTDLWGDAAGMAYINPNPTDEEEPVFGFTFGRQYGEVDGVPLLGLSGQWDKNPWVTSVWYGEDRLAWLANADAGYLITNTCA